MLKINPASWVSRARDVKTSVVSLVFVGENARESVPLSDEDGKIVTGVIMTAIVGARDENVLVRAIYDIVSKMFGPQEWELKDRN